MLVILLLLLYSPNCWMVLRRLLHMVVRHFLSQRETTVLHADYRLFSSLFSSLFAGKTPSHVYTGPLSLTSSLFHWAHRDRIIGPLLPICANVGLSLGVFSQSKTIFRSGSLACWCWRSLFVQAGTQLEMLEGSTLSAAAILVCCGGRVLDSASAFVWSFPGQWCVWKSSAPTNEQLVPLVPWTLEATAVHVSVCQRTWKGLPSK